MPTRTVKFKLIVPRGSETESLRARRALWATHAFVNEAAAHYERLLLEMRQGDVLVPAGKEKEEVEAGELWRNRLRTRLSGMGHSPKSIEAALPLFRALYEAIVKSSVEPNKGAAQDGRAFHSPLVDASSKAGESRKQKLALLLPLLDHEGDSPEAWATRAKTLVEENASELLQATGSPSAWVRLYRKSDPKWPASLLEYLKKEQKASASGAADPLSALQALQMLPIAAPFSEGRLAEAGKLNTYERMAFALVVSHLNAWESWTFRTKDQYEKRTLKVREWEALYAEPFADALSAVRAFEAVRAKEISAVSFWSADSVYRLRDRELRGWRELREWLRAHRGASAEDRATKVADLQRQLGRDFGSAIVLQWLALPENQRFADHPDDPIPKIARYNGFLCLVERSRSLPLYTAPEPRRHPQWAGFDPPNNTNQPPFRLASGERGKATLEIELLAPGEDGLLGREKFSFALAPSGQFVKGEFLVREDGGKKKHIVLEARSQDRLDRVQGQVGGSNLLFDRSLLDHTELQPLRQGNIGSVYLKVAVDSGDAESEEGYGERDRLATWLKSGPEKRSGASLPKPEGFSILSVDLGLRSAASVSVFRVMPEGQAAGRPWPGSTVGNLQVVHERSAILRLPGEDPGKKEREDLRREEEEVRAMGAMLSPLRISRSLCVAEEPETRERRIAELLLSEWVRALHPQLLSEVEALRPLAGIPQEEWFPLAEKVFLAWEQVVGVQIGAWRRRTRLPRKSPLGGKSARRIEYLERVRKVLVAWHCHQRPRDQEVKRLDRGRYGTVASALLEHINGLKDDRVKTTADLIVQAARGMTYQEGSWRRAHEPVDAIVLEDLNRYRSRTDRPPAENRQLMKWCHREIRRVVEQQARVYGIPVLDTAAAFSSRFDALTRAPGFRCFAADKNYLGFLKGPKGKASCEKLLRMGLDPAHLREGDLLPLGGGELLASPTGPEGVRVRHADINAAQNLGVWCLEAYSKPTKLTAVRLSEDPPLYAAAGLGKRLKAALGGEAVVLRPAADGEGFEAEPYATWAKAAKALGISKPKDAALVGEAEGASPDEEAAELDEMEAELTGERFNLFRDPSGTLFGGRWVDSKRFWTKVREEVVRRLRASGQLHGKP